MTPDERKKYISKKRKEEARKLEVAEKEKQTTKQKPEQGPKKPVDPDPEGKLLEQVEDKLAEATKYLKTLRIHAPNVFEVNVLAVEVYIRKSKSFFLSQSQLILICGFCREILVGSSSIEQSYFFE
jgi:hypothetical protein